MRPIITPYTIWQELANSRILQACNQLLAQYAAEPKHDIYCFCANCIGHKHNELVAEGFAPILIERFHFAE